MSIPACVCLSLTLLSACLFCLGLWFCLSVSVSFSISLSLSLYSSEAWVRRRRLFLLIWLCMIVYIPVCFEKYFCFPVCSCDSRWTEAKPSRGRVGDWWSGRSEIWWSCPRWYSRCSGAWIQGFNLLSVLDFYLRTPYSVFFYSFLQFSWLHIQFLYTIFSFYIPYSMFTLHIQFLTFYTPCSA